MKNFGSGMWWGRRGSCCTVARISMGRCGCEHVAAAGMQAWLQAGASRPGPPAGAAAGLLHGQAGGTHPCAAAPLLCPLAGATSVAPGCCPEPGRRLRERASRERKGAGGCLAAWKSTTAGVRLVRTLCSMPTAQRLSHSSARSARAAQHGRIHSACMAPRPGSAAPAAAPAMPRLTQHQPLRHHILQEPLQLLAVVRAAAARGLHQQVEGRLRAAAGSKGRHFRLYAVCA